MGNECIVKDLDIIPYSSLTDMHSILTGIRITIVDITLYNYTYAVGTYIHVRRTTRKIRSIKTSHPTFQRQVIRVKYS